METPTPEKTSPQLDLRDLVAVVELIDVVSRRGAFEGSELTNVGALRTRFVKFIEALQPPKKEETTVPASEIGKVEQFPKQ